MKTKNKIFISLSTTVIIFTITIVKYTINCMNENMQGYGHFFVWLKRGFSSLSFQVDFLGLILDFFIFFFIILILLQVIKKDISKRITILLYSMSLIIILMIIPFFIISEIYFEKIDCDVIYSSISYGW